MERRKIVKIFEGRYQLLKPTDSKLSGWFKYGENKSTKAIVDLFNSGRFDLEMSGDIKNDIEQYEIRQAKRVGEHYSKKTLESKTI
ncbi:MAG: hypothetical protein NTU63_02695 [Candidatus Pacearchaeota archaeon]|nr:hypothetical protein [Candidatus Pacearchaeota archaeon]